MASDVPGIELFFSDSNGIRWVLRWDGQLSEARAEPARMFMRLMANLRIAN